jgi:hypothetical protein
MPFAGGGRKCSRHGGYLVARLCLRRLLRPGLSISIDLNCLELEESCGYVWMLDGTGTCLPASDRRESTRIIVIAFREWAVDRLYQRLGILARRSGFTVHHRTAEDDHRRVTCAPAIREVCGTVGTRDYVCAIKCFAYSSAVIPNVDATAARAVIG